MTQVTYQKKLSRHFTRYAAVLVLLLFVAFTLILSVYTIGLNIYRNDRNNSLLSDSFSLTHKEYTEFLEDGNTRDLFQRRLQGDVSEQYLAYQYRQFSRTAHLPGMLILSDEQGDILYVSASTDTLSTHLKYFNKLIHHNLMQTPASYTTVYRFLNKVGKYVIAAPVPDKNGRMIGSAVIYIDDSSWEEIMRLNQFDGIITDESGHIIAASNRNMVENQTFFSDDDRLLYRHQADRYWSAVSHLPQCGVYIHTFLKSTGIGPYYFLTLIELAVLLAGLLLTGRLLSQRIAGLNSRSLEILHREINAIQTSDANRRISLDSGDEFEDIAHHINNMLNHLESLGNRNLVLEQLNSQMERLRLEAQFDPHFLYNNLENIRYAIRMGDKDADDIILKLTSLLRYSISTSKSVVTLQEDLHHLHDYLSIIQFRFRDRFHFSISVPADCLDHLCPRMCLQPLLENSVKYVLQRQQVLHISVRAWKDDSFLYLEVTDNGHGFEPDKLAALRGIISSDHQIQSPHHGLRNVARRLALQFGADSCMTLDNLPGSGAQIVLRIAHRQEVLP